MKIKNTFLLFCGFFLFGEIFAQALADPVPVQAAFSVETGWVTTIKICNNSLYSIPLRNVELDFDYGNEVATVWGSPSLDWKSTSSKGKVVLVGGTQSSYPPDQKCTNPVTVSFSSDLSAAAPKNFVLKAEGGTPMSHGNIDLQMPKAPFTTAPSPQVTISGMGVVQQKPVSWNSDWMLNDLVTGIYNVTADGVDNGSEYYKAVIKSPVIVTDKTTVSVPVNYDKLPTAKVTVDLVNAPDAAEMLNFTGDLTYTRKAATHDELLLPKGTYKLISNLPGYEATIEPNPLMLNDNMRLVVTYKKSANQKFVGYFQSWSDVWASEGSKTQLAQLPDYVNVVIISFIMPEAEYAKGSFNLQGTGLNFSYDGKILKQAIDYLHAAHPNTKILIAVGGATYNNWDKLNTSAIADFIKDFGLDGVDVDYEIDPGCAVGKDKHIHCAVDQQYSAIVTNFRKALPRPYLLTVAGWSTGAYGEDQWEHAEPYGLSHNGETLPLLRTNAEDIDMISIMAYDAGAAPGGSTGYEPKIAYQAHKNYFKGDVALGLETPAEAWGGHVLTLKETNELADFVLSSAAGGAPAMMLWSIQKQPEKGEITPTEVGQAVCKKFGLKDCDLPLIK